MQPGWNSVYLDVLPPDTAPEAVFAGLPIEIVATWFRCIRQCNSSRIHPRSHGNRRAGVFGYAPDRPDAFLSNLHAVHDHRAYLVKARAACKWTVTGEGETPGRLRWQPSSFSFTGLPVDPAAPPTFAQFFASSAAHNGQTVFQLEQGIWTPIRNPATTRIRPGEAYWIYANGGSEYQGPLRVTGLTDGGIDFGSVGEQWKLQLKAADQELSAVSVETVGAGALPLSYGVRESKTPTTRYVRWSNPLQLTATWEGGFEVRLQVQRAEMTTFDQDQLLRVTGGGVEFHLPVKAHRADVAAQR